MAVIDDFEKKLILELQKDARVSKVTLANKLFASERTVRNRIQRLFDNGLIRPSITVDLFEMGFQFLGIMALQVDIRNIQSAGAELARISNVCYLVNTTGRFEFLAIIVTRTAKEFAKVVEEHISKIPGVLHTETFVALNLYKGSQNGLEIGPLIDTMDTTDTP
jgi:Lrp/AsnC family transcriptional regulator, regulator for asnA, asnC and gidA